MNETEVCFQHSGNDPVKYIKVQKCEDPTKKCFLNPNEYAWIDSDLQFQSITERSLQPREQSQIYNKLVHRSCQTITSLEKNLNNGRKCVYAYQCKSRFCDPETISCKGREMGETCSIHEECDKGLACRTASIWPYETLCLPMSDVGSQCETDFDCKPRNFCW